MTHFIEEIQAQMQQLLPPSRFLHTLGVAHMAASLAMCYEQDTNQAFLAGLLHDNAKYIPFEIAIKECQENLIALSEIELQNPMLIHGKLGAFYAKTKYHIEDKEILSAILYHTTGKVKMSFLEKSIFLSDYIEPRRTQATTPKLDVIRSTAFHNLDLAVCFALQNTLSYLEQNNRKIDPTSVEAYQYYKQICQSI